MKKSMPRLRAPHMEHMERPALLIVFINEAVPVLAIAPAAAQAPPLTTASCVPESIARQ